MQSDGISSTVVLKFECFMNVHFMGLRVNSLVSASQGKNVVTCLPSYCLSPLTLLVSIGLTEHFVGSHCYYCDLLEKF